MTDPIKLPTRHVFVYGTLRRGESNDITRLSPAPRFVGLGEVAGTMFDLGPYPGVLLGPSAVAGGQGAAVGTVVGEVYAISTTLEVVLDAIEEVYPQATGEYTKRSIHVLAAGRSWECIVYEINPLRTAGRPVVAGGDWVISR